MRRFIVVLTVLLAVGGGLALVVPSGASSQADPGTVPTTTDATTVAPAPVVAPPCVAQVDYARYVRAVYKRRTVSQKARREMNREHTLLCSRKAQQNMSRLRGHLLHQRMVRIRAARARRLAARFTPYGQWAIPEYIVMCESGGRNLAPNSATASGYYQFINGTWKQEGGSTSAAYLASKAEQDRLAAKLWAGGAGAGNWDCA